MSTVPFEITMGSDNLLGIASINEEGLYPGQSRETQGLLSLPVEKLQVDNFKFEDLAHQAALHALGLKSQDKDLSYSLSDNHQILTAKAGVDGADVFTVKLNHQGGYLFELLGHIDRPIPENLAKDNFDIQTEPNAPYQLTFYTAASISPTATPPDHIKVMWGDELLFTLNPSTDGGKGFSFSVEGHPENNFTPLKFIASGDQPINNYIEDVTVTSNSLSKIPLEFGFLFTDQENNIHHNHFTVNVTTTPPIELDNQMAFDLVYEQGVYHSIIVSDENMHQNPLNTINLDALFKNLEIPEEHRMVQVVQLQESGQATNFYEIKISDKTETLEPITVANVQLSFPGGDGGLNVFYRNINIEEGSSNLPSVSHEIIT